MSDGYDFAIGIEGGPFLTPVRVYTEGVEGGLYGEGSIGAGHIRFRLGFGQAEETTTFVRVEDPGTVLSEVTSSVRQTRLSLLFSPQFLQSPHDPSRFHAALLGGLDLHFDSIRRQTTYPEEGDREPISEDFDVAALGGIISLEGRLPLVGVRLLATASGWLSSLVKFDGKGLFTQAGAFLGLRYEL